MYMYVYVCMYVCMVVDLFGSRHKTVDDNFEVASEDSSSISPPPEMLNESCDSPVSQETLLDLTNSCTGSNFC